ncbi:OsmC family protein [Caenimonas sedimenti]|uniref:OsmC family protein n=1 Tax=Caenimonas sedimenti TaxID=2596921 RepID=A0A562ZNY7_9BURK|nr:OsmC family protein [Caenimonas sedimenti]TWO70280.1 OsmC family protein [Caenimonas sedimenti]
MTQQAIRQGLAGVLQHYAQHPEQAVGNDRPATAVVEQGLRCRAEGPNGAVLVTDMPVPLGGGASAPTSGWFLRAALATCDATMIALRAAQLGVTLTQLEVTVESRSDNRVMLGGAEGGWPGPLDMRVRVRIAADGVPAEQLHAIVDWAESHSPVGDALKRAVAVSVEVETAAHAANVT